MQQNNDLHLVSTFGSVQLFRNDAARKQDDENTTGSQSTSTGESDIGGKGTSAAAKTSGSVDSLDVENGTVPPVGVSEQRQDAYDKQAELKYLGELEKRIRIADATLSDADRF